MRRILAALLPGLMIFAGPLRAAEVVTFTLDNGMEVLVLEDHRAPVVVQTVWYRVGAADEPEGKSGIAHYLEHLMFKATDELESGEFSNTVARNGGSDNAFTSYDYTAYFQRIASDRLELMMQMEASRVDGLQLVEADIASERDVVIEERNQRTENDAGALFAEQRSAAQYLNHPYGIPIIGWKHEAEALALDDAVSFYKQHYGPNNAILIVAGDVVPDEVRALAEKYYGVIPPNPNIKTRNRVAEPPQLAERRLKYEDARVGQPYVIRTYLAPERDPGAQQEAAALTLLAEVLGGSGTTSVLAEKLQFDDAKAIYASAFYSGMSLDVTTFGLVMIPVEGVTLAEAESALDNSVAEFIEEGVDSEDLDRIKLQLRASEIYALDNINSLARTYGAALTSGLTVQDVDDWLGILEAVTEEDIIAAAKRVFDKRRSVTGWVMPEGTEEVMQ
jgi:zinc protease